ncbi:hypothetical protein GCM10009731_42020 [Streptomyces globosus]
MFGCTHTGVPDGGERGAKARRRGWKTTEAATPHRRGPGRRPYGLVRQARTPLSAARAFCVTPRFAHA